MNKYIENNMVLIDRKYAKTQLKNLAALILEESGISVRSKKSILVSYPGEFLDVNWIKNGFNDDFDMPEFLDDSAIYHVDLKDSSYRVYFEKVVKKGRNHYFKDLYIKLEVKDRIYDAETERIYDVCEVKAWMEEGDLDGSFKTEKTVIDFETFSDLNKICLNEIFTGRKKQIDRFNLIVEKESCLNQLEELVNKSINELAKKYGLVIYLNPDLEFNNGIIQSSTTLVEYKKRDIECDISFRELPISNSNLICIELYLIDTRDFFYPHRGDEELCSVIDMEKYLNKVIIKALK